MAWSAAASNASGDSQPAAEQPWTAPIEAPDFALMGTHDEDQFVDRLPDAFAEGLHALLVDSLGVNAELVAAITSHDIALPYRAIESIGNLLQHQIAESVAERIVKGLETVEVQKEHAELR